MTKLFHINIQVKNTKIDALFDSGSQENLIAVELVKKLGLEVRDHPNPYPLGWVYKDVDMKVTKQCKIRFFYLQLYILIYPSQWIWVWMVMKF